MLVVPDSDFACGQSERRDRGGDENNRHELTPWRAMRAVKGNEMGSALSVGCAALANGGNYLCCRRSLGADFKTYPSSRE
jgi:hypothetical protein